MKATAVFDGDSSVGIFGYSFDMEVPEFDEEFREEVRAKIKETYDWLDGEFTCQVYFSDERLD